MKSEASLVYEVWEAVRDYIPASRRAEVALSVLRSFEEFGFESSDLVDLVDEDDILAAAFKSLFGTDDDLIDEDEDY